MHSIRKVYVIHHSHTDIGYTDLQERIIDTQINYIRTVLEMMEKPENRDFRWTCETLFCVEQFLKEADDHEKAALLRLIKDGKIGLSASYFNFTDLVDCPIYQERLLRWSDYFRQHDIKMQTAMIADINGISMGQRDALIKAGVEFLFTNIHCHHGMYPMYQNQNAYWWENAEGEKLLVWNGEHYNLGNALGIKPNTNVNYMIQNYMGNNSVSENAVKTLYNNLDAYLTSCENEGYPYDFIITAVSGVFSDNAPPSLEILHTIDAYNQLPEAVPIQMVSLQEFYAEIRGKLQDAPVVRGDLNDWWANGVGAQPYAVKHYRDAQHKYHLCERLDPEMRHKWPELAQTAQDNLFLYAEHTFGHSATVQNPMDSMVLHLDMRKNSYASKAHEAISRIQDKIAMEKGDSFRYYDTSGNIEVCNINHQRGPQAVEFYIENLWTEACEVETKEGKIITCQVSDHPRGKKISFVDAFEPFEKRTYTYRRIPKKQEIMNSRKCYVGSERIRDIVNDYDSISYKLPYAFENKWFKIAYRPGEGVLSFIDKRNGHNLMANQEYPLFTPLYECTSLNSHEAQFQDTDTPPREERRILGRNIRGRNAKLHVGQLDEILCLERGPVFTVLKLCFTLPGTIECAVTLKFYEEIPQLDIRLSLGKTLSKDIESIYLPMTLQKNADSTLYLRKGDREAFRPGIDQIPGTCMEYYASDNGIAFLSETGSILLEAKDTPLWYMGEMRHHAIKLCDGDRENNRRPIYSWVMNNTWETNFRMDLSGFCAFDYRLILTDEKSPEAAMDELRERSFSPYVFILD